MPSDPIPIPDLRDKISKRIAIWRNELLDLTRNNRLVHHKPSAKALRLEAPDVFALADRLDADGKGWLFYEPPAPAQGQDERDDATNEDEGAAPEGMRDAQAEPELEDGVARAHEQNAKKLRLALKTLKQRAHEALEERGVHVLYLAAGALYYTDNESSELSRAPLILFPVEIRQENRTAPYELVPATDEEIIGNAGLQEKLRRDLDIDLPDLPSPDQVDRSDGDDLCRTYFETIDALITKEQRQLGWRVSHEAWLDAFSFHKLVMYADLDKNAERVASHPAVCAMVGGRPGPDAFGPALPLDDRLDEQALVRDACHVMDADSSQLAVLDAVRRGTSLVLHGPPGTGKSQTIANVISQSLAEGKSVLFVSEKMEALKVVHDRLCEAGLEDLCLELHSHKANKKAVIGELARRMQEQLESKLVVDEPTLHALDAHRESLNAYVRELHEIRQPFGRSIRHALAEVVAASGLHLPPVPQAERAAVEAMTGAAWTQVENSAASLESVWHVIEAPDRLAWRGARPRLLDGQSAAEIEGEINALERAVQALRAAGAPLSAALGLAEPGSPEDAFEQVELARQLRTSPGVPDSYFEQSFDRLRARMEETRAQVAKLAELRAQVGALVPEQPRFAAEDLRSLSQRLSDALEGWTAAEPTVGAVQALGPILRELAEAADGLAGAGAEVAAALGLTERFTPASLARLHRVGAACLDSMLLPAGLLVPAQLAEARAVLPQRKALWEADRAAAAALAEVADDSILELDIDELLASYRTRFDGFLRVFKPAYWKAEGELKKHLKAAGTPLPRAEVLELARTARDSRAQVRGLESQDAQLFGSLAQGSETDVAKLEAALERAFEILDLVEQRPLPDQLVGMLTCGGLVPSTFRTAVTGLAGAQHRFETAADRLAHLGGRQGGSRGSASETTPVTELAAWARETAALLASTPADLAAIPAQAAGCSLSEYAELVARDTTRRELAAALDRAAPELGALYGDVYRGEATDFGAIEQKLAFAERLRTQFFPLLAPSVRALAAQVRPEIPQLVEVERAAAGFRDAEAKLGRRFESGAVSTFARPLVAQPYAAALAALGELRDRRNEIDELARVEAVRARFRELGLGETLQALLAERGTSAEFERRLQGTLYQCWLDHQIARVPVLRDFDALTHERRIGEFRALDRRMWEHGAHRVIAGFNRSQPEHRIRTQEHAVLQREAVKSRRIMPLRRLFSEIPTLISQLKPCLMMSPISLAQYLADSELMFDLVVFDEASQIAPEDAIGAIVRGKQVVVCGDPKQLPPTAFFTRSFLEGDEHDEEDDTPEVDSVLEQLQGAGLPERRLRWHYRSEHPDLIEFSNQKFYESALFTFPNRLAGAPDLGVKFVHVEDGIYDRGKSRTNRVEAERVADLVIDHWKRWGKKRTLAVVTLSVTQQRAVRDAIERALARHPELEGYYRDDERDGFRVKNLESVQGDERDVIIVSIGYGPSQQGDKPTYHFGPINQQGGARRLNVLVTRAKRTVVLVASFRARDLAADKTSNDGVRLLLKYMEYAEHGPSVLETEVQGGGDFESQFEASVASAVRELGYEVVPQVGCGKWRIDLGVRRLDQPGAFLLGIECDGARYHGSATARDRDRLRQQVLEDKFGWTIHRIWGPDWLRARRREIDRLRDALDLSARRVAGAEPAAPKPVERTPIEKTTVAPPVDLKSSDARPPWALPFEAANPARLDLAGDGTNVTQVPVRTLAQQVARIAQAENGVHLDRAIYLILEARGIKRLGSAIHNHFKRVKSVLPDGYTHEAGFIYPPSYVPRVLVWDGKSERRGLEAIPRRELEHAAEKLLESAGALGWDELIDQLARLYGVQRVTQQSKAALEPVLKAACKAGRFANENGRVRNQ